ncbi:MAG TPA: PKD domain-containing protein [Thermoanaerobaculaceae bacterium]|nr:PKD domain-containing protein [Thermoanaerobaculaceae bacterium]
MRRTAFALALTVAAVTLAPASRAQSVVLSESFTIWPPPGWSMTGNGCGAWGAPDLAAYPNYTGGSGAYAGVDSADCEGAIDTALTTPVFALPANATAATLTFKHDFFAGTFGGDAATVEVSADGGGSWTQLAAFGADSQRGPLQQTVDLSSYAGSPGLEVRFRFVGGGGHWWWQLDDVEVSATACAAPLAPTIAGEPVGCAATGVTLSTGSYAAYQWQKDGADIPGATSGTLVVTSSGGYAVRVADAEGCTGVSQPFQVTILDGPAAPSVATGDAGCGWVTLSTGSYAAYQWNLGGAPIAGATSQTYRASASGAYSVTVRDGAGCAATSASSAVAVPTAPVITAQPQSQSVPAGGSATLSVAASGGGSLGYQWYRGLGGDTSAPVAGAAGASLTVQNLTTTASYWVRVTSGSCTTDSVAATISVGNALTVDASAKPTAGIRPLWVSFRAAAAGGAAPYAYSWTFGDGGTASGALASHLYFAAGSYTAKVVVTDSERPPNRASAQVAVTVREPLAANAAAKPSSGPAPLTVDFTGSAAGGAAPYAYQWDFGDGSAKASGSSARHVYRSRGTFMATLTVSDGAGASARDTVRVVAK